MSQQDITAAAPMPRQNSQQNFLSVSVKGVVITRKKAIFTHIIFTAINFLNYTDRYAIAGVLPDIQDYFGINDTEAGLIQSIFIIVYMLCAPLFGFLGDRFVRRYILMFGILAWSLFTLSGSFVGANHFWLFLMCRGLVGVGESSYITVAPAMIGDLFSESERMLALSIYSFGALIGSGFGYILGSVVTSIAKSCGADDDSAWKWSLRVTPIFGVAAVILTLLFVPEPTRGAREASNESANEIVIKTSLKDDIIYLVKNRTVLFCTLGFTAVTYVAGSLSFWAPNFLETAYLAQGTVPNSNYIALGFGAITCACGIAGISLGSYLARRYRERALNSEPLVSAYGLVICGPFIFFGLILVEASPITIWPAIIIGEISLFLNWALVPKILIDCVVPNRRAVASGVSNMVSHLFGDAYSPFFIGFVADLTYKGPTYYDDFKGLQLGLLTCPIVSVLGGAAFFACAYYYQRDKQETDDLVAQRAHRGRKPAQVQEQTGGALVDGGSGNEVNEESESNSEMSSSENLLRTIHKPAKINGAAHPNNRSSTVGDTNRGVTDSFPLLN